VAQKSLGRKGGLLLRIRSRRRIVEVTLAVHPKVLHRSARALKRTHRRLTRRQMKRQLRSSADMD